MYDFPEVRAATDALWSALARALRARGVAAPDTLTRDADPMAVWRDPALLLAQTCGWPYATRLRGRVRLVATPCYAAPGCEGARYRSALIARADDTATGLEAMRGRIAAVNGPDSHSGCHALRALAAPLARDGRFFAAVRITGAHRASACAVAAGAADVAALDCVTWALIGRYDPMLAARLKVIGWSAAAPGLPLITAADPAVAQAIRAATLETFAAPETAAPRAALLIDGAQALEDDAYAAILAIAADADALGYRRLA